MQLTSAVVSLGAVCAFTIPQPLLQLKSAIVHTVFEPATHSYHKVKASAQSSWSKGHSSQSSHSAHSSWYKSHSPTHYWHSAKSAISHRFRHSHSSSSSSNNGGYTSSSGYTSSKTRAFTNGDHGETNFGIYNAEHHEGDVCGPEENVCATGRTGKLTCKDGKYAYEECETGTTCKHPSFDHPKCQK